jgi:putative ATP-dependent endonuclease of OLD family
LDPSDYLFLQRFLDATRANLFFARGVLIVEGDAENMLLPAIAEILGIPLSRYGVSIVNVGHRGLFRYARIFQRFEPPEFEGIRVACLADLDPRAGENAAQLAARRRALHERVEGGTVRAFVAEQNTFEYDLAYSGLADYLLVALRLASTNDTDPANLRDVENAAWTEFSERGPETAEERAIAIYELVKNKKAITAQYLSYLIFRDWTQGRLDAASFAELVPTYILDAFLYLMARELD